MIQVRYLYINVCVKTCMIPFVKSWKQFTSQFVTNVHSLWLVCIVWDSCTYYSRESAWKMYAFDAVGEASIVHSLSCVVQCTQLVMCTRTPISRITCMHTHTHTHTWVHALKWAHTRIAAEDGVQAVRATARFKYDIVLMDGFMPNKTGWEVKITNK